ncbi:hypothetical protein INR49_002399 [Caranx melampygus]|nr:hypothetical protein INR49_002399 [Caranx melampygus]
MWSYENSVELSWAVCSFLRFSCLSAVPSQLRQKLREEEEVEVNVLVMVLLGFNVRSVFGYSCDVMGKEACEMSVEKDKRYLKKT